MKYEVVKNYYNGAFHESAAAESLDVVSSIDGNLLSKVPMSSVDELNAAVESAKMLFRCGVRHRSKSMCDNFARCFRFPGLVSIKVNSTAIREDNRETWKKTNLRVN